jgi:predicted AAA+ superfamily ATPase
LDEIHKYARWKSWLKGLYDKEGKTLQVVVTGSAKLDLFQRGGDSLLGRYNLLRLHPLSLGEITHQRLIPPPASAENWLAPGTFKAFNESWSRLALRSGFPEPYLRNEDRHYQRWASRRSQLLIQEDIQSLTDIRHLSLIEHLALLLPERVGSLLSVNALREEIAVAHDTVSSWIEALERIYYCFLLKPFHRKISRSLKKERKLYLWDWSGLKNPAARFENMVASHLLKAVHLWTDLGYGDFELFYWRDREKREVDFVITRGKKPVALMECKRTDPSLSESLRRLGKDLGPIPMIQLVETSHVDFKKGLSRVVSALDYLVNFP